MPLLPIFMKLMGSAAMRGTGRIGLASVAGAGFAQNYTRDFGEGVKRGLKQRVNGVADGRNFVAYAQGGLKKLFYELPKAIGQRRWGEHMAGALVKVTSERLATMNAALAPYGGGAHTYAQSMTSLADKAFKLGFGEADWIKSMMKYTLGEYDPFGSGPNGMKTKEENLAWFKDRYNGRSDLVDEARTIGGILGLTPDIIKLIIDGHRELLEKGNHLTADQVRVSRELEFTRKQTEAKWQEVADIWGSKTAGFWTTWEEGKGKFFGFLADLGKEEKTQQEVDKYVSEELLLRIDQIVKTGKGNLASNDVKEIGIWKNLINRGYLQNLNANEIDNLAYAISKTGHMSKAEAIERLNMAVERENGIALDKRYVLPEKARAKIKDADNTEEGLRESGKDIGFWGGFADSLYDFFTDPLSLAAPTPIGIGVGVASLVDAWKLDRKNPTYTDSVGATRRKNALMKGVSLTNGFGGSTFASDEDRDLFLENAIAFNKADNISLTDEMLERMYLNPERYVRLINQKGRVDFDTGYAIMSPTEIRQPHVSATGMLPTVENAEKMRREQEGDRTFTNSPTIIVKSTEEGVDFLELSIEKGKEWLSGAGVIEPLMIGSQTLSEAYLSR